MKDSFQKTLKSSQFRAYDEHALSDDYDNPGFFSLEAMQNHLGDLSEVTQRYAKQTVTLLQDTLRQHNFQHSIDDTLVQVEKVIHTLDSWKHDEKERPWHATQQQLSRSLTNVFNEIQSIDGDTFTHLVAEVADKIPDLEITLQTLKDFGFDFNKQNNEGNSFSHIFASVANQIENLKEVLPSLSDLGIDFNIQNQLGDSFSHIFAGVADKVNDLKGVLQSLETLNLSSIISHTSQDNIPQNATISEVLAEFQFPKQIHESISYAHNTLLPELNKIKTKFKDDSGVADIAESIQTKIENLYNTSKAINNLNGYSSIDNTGNAQIESIPLTIDLNNQINDLNQSLTTLHELKETLANQNQEDSTVNMFNQLFTRNVERMQAMLPHEKFKLSEDLHNYIVNMYDTLLPNLASLNAINSSLKDEYNISSLTESLQAKIENLYNTSLSLHDLKGYYSFNDHNNIQTESFPIIIDLENQINDLNNSLTTLHELKHKFTTYNEQESLAIHFIDSLTHKTQQLHSCLPSENELQVLHSLQNIEISAQNISQSVSYIADEIHSLTEALPLPTIQKAIIDLNLQNNEGNTFGHIFAGIADNIPDLSDTLQILHDAGLNFNMQNNEGNTFTHIIAGIADRIPALNNVLQTLGNISTQFNLQNIDLEKFINIITGIVDQINSIYCNLTSIINALDEYYKTQIGNSNIVNIINNIREKIGNLYNNLSQSANILHLYFESQNLNWENFQQLLNNIYGQVNDMPTLLSTLNDLHSCLNVTFAQTEETPVFHIMNALSNSINEINQSLPSTAQLANFSHSFSIITDQIHNVPNFLPAFSNLSMPFDLSNINTDMFNNMLNGFVEQIQALYNNLPALDELTQHCNIQNINENAISILESIKEKIHNLYEKLSLALQNLRASLEANNISWEAFSKMMDEIYGQINDLTATLPTLEELRQYLDPQNQAGNAVSNIINNLSNSISNIRNSLPSTEEIRTSLGIPEINTAHISQEFANFKNKIPSITEMFEAVQLPAINFNLQNNLEETCAHIIAEISDKLKDLKGILPILLNDLGIDFALQDKIGNTFSHIIAKFADKIPSFDEILIQMHELGIINFDVRNCEGDAFVHILSKALTNTPELISISRNLLEIKDDAFGMTNAEGCNFFHITSMRTGISNFKDYLHEQICANINVPNNLGETLLHNTIKYIKDNRLSLQTVSYLLKNGINPNLADNYGSTSLHYSTIYHAGIGVVAELLGYNADPSITNNQNQTALDLMDNPDVSETGINQQEEKRIRKMFRNALLIQKIGVSKTLSAKTFIVSILLCAVGMILFGEAEIFPTILNSLDIISNEYLAMPFIPVGTTACVAVLATSFMFPAFGITLLSVILVVAAVGLIGVIGVAFFDFGDYLLDLFRDYCLDTASECLSELSHNLTDNEATNNFVQEKARNVINSTFDQVKQSILGQEKQSVDVDAIDPVNPQKNPQPQPVPKAEKGMLSKFMSFITGNNDDDEEDIDNILP